MIPSQSMEALHRLSEDQFRKFMEQGVNPAILQQQFNVNLGLIQQQQQLPRPPQQNTSQSSHPR